MFPALGARARRRACGGSPRPPPFRRPRRGGARRARCAAKRPDAGAAILRDPVSAFQGCPGARRRFPHGLLRAVRSGFETAQRRRFAGPYSARPADLVTFLPGEAPPGFPEGLSGARRRDDGVLLPYPDRETIERERRDPVLWLRDAVEAFLIQVQGSAQVEFPDGRQARLAYDGRNGLALHVDRAHPDRERRDRGRRDVACRSSRPGCVQPVSARANRASR